MISWFLPAASASRLRTPFPNPGACWYQLPTRLAYTRWPCWTHPAKTSYRSFAHVSAFEGWGHANPLDLATRLSILDRALRPLGVRLSTIKITLPNQAVLEAESGCTVLDAV